MLAQSDRLMDFGVLGVILFILVSALVAVGLWLKPKIDRAFEKHLELIDTLNRQLPKQTEVLGEALKNQDFGRETLNRIIKLLEEQKGKP